MTHMHVQDYLRLRDEGEN